MLFAKHWPSWVAVLMLIVGGAVAASAQDNAPTSSHRAATTARAVARPAAVTPHRLPPDSVTKHSLALPGRTLTFTATAGTIRLTNGQGEEQAEIAYVAYQLDHMAAAKRPVTFVFNGGPGAASAWLQLGALGPWRLPLETGKIYPSRAPVLVDNADTWLDFTDLVFIDPPGTGYSEIVASGSEVRKKLWSVRGDIDALATVIRRWLAANERLVSPKFIVGESYGGFRGPLLAQALATQQGIGISGLVLISPALDMSTRSASDPFYWAIRLPSYAAAERERKGPVTRAALADVEAYAGGQYLTDFLRGPRDAEAVARMVKEVTQLTGLDPALVKRLGGRIDKTTFQRAFDRAQGKVGSYYDTTITAYDPEPQSDYNRWIDPVTGFEAPLASAMMDLYAHQLVWRIDQRYQMLNDDVARAWDWGRGLGPVTAIPSLKRMLALDPNFRVLVAQGLTDVQVPYFGTKLLLDQIPDYGAPGRVAFKVYPGGHMLYTRDASRQALRRDAEKLME